MRKTGFVTVLVLAFSLGWVLQAYAVGSYLSDLNSRYSSSYSCTVCHTSTSGQAPRNAYGQAFEAANNSFEAIEAQDSDSDGFTNLVELQAGTLPGDANSKPSGPGPGPVDLTSYENQWFQLKLITKGRLAGGPRLVLERGTANAYLHLGTFQDPNTALEGDEFFADTVLWVLNSQTNSWEQWATGDLHVTPGNSMAFLVWMHSDTGVDSGDGLRVSFSGQILAREARGGGLGLVRMLSLGGYLVEVTSGGEHRAAGLKLVGRMVPESSVPSPPK
ncbi:MAG: hypothetical protein WHX93_05605 [bacterium]